MTSYKHNSLLCEIITPFRCYVPNLMFYKKYVKNWKCDFLYNTLFCRHSHIILCIHYYIVKMSLKVNDHQISWINKHVLVNCYFRMFLQFWLILNTENGGYNFIYHTSNKFPAFPLVKMTSRDCPIFYYIGSVTKNMGLVKLKMASYINIK